MKTNTTIRGKVYVLKDNIDTDQIIPAIYLNLVPTIPDEYRKLGSYALCGLPKEYETFVEEGTCESEFSIIIAGSNFGCGSSREHAPIALGAAGVKAVIAESYARIFFRNSVATGELYPLESEKRLCDIFSTGDEVEILPELNAIRHIGSGHSFTLKPLGAVKPIIQAGGIFKYARETGMIPSTSSATPKKDIKKNSKTKVIALANQKGGVGKTTSVVNLAACLQALKQKILVVDMDPQANATSGLGLTKEEGVSLYKLLIDGGDINSMIRKTPIKGLDVIPSELDLAGAEVDVAKMDEYLHKFSELLAPVVDSETYDFILVDCPPSLGMLTMNALTAADSVILPIQCEYYALEGLSVISDLVKQLRESEANPNIKIEGILMTMFDSRTKLASDVVREVREHFKDKVYKSVIPRNVRLSEAPSFGQPVIKYARLSSGARAYTKFAKEFLKRTKSQ